MVDNVHHWGGKKSIVVCFHRQERNGLAYTIGDIFFPKHFCKDSNIITKEIAQGLGIKEFVVKPIVKKEITQLIRKILDDEGVTVQ